MGALRNIATPEQAWGGGQLAGLLKPNYKPWPAPKPSPAQAILLICLYLEMALPPEEAIDGGLPNTYGSTGQLDSWSEVQINRGRSWLLACPRYGAEKRDGSMWAR